jgi:hypothetical protein
MICQTDGRLKVRNTLMQVLQRVISPMWLVIGIDQALAETLWCMEAKAAPSTLPGPFELLHI